MTEHTDDATAEPASPPEALEERVLPSDPLLAALAEPFPEVHFDHPRDEDVAIVPREQLAEFAAVARGAGFELFSDLAAVDYLRRRPRFEVVVNLVSIRHRRRLRIRVEVPADDPSVPSLTPVYAGAAGFEREAYDLVGITFDGHPDLTRILMPDDWEGHPLRKDYPVGAVPVQFRHAPKIH